MPHPSHIAHLHLLLLSPPLPHPHDSCNNAFRCFVRVVMSMGGAMRLVAVWCAWRSPIAPQQPWHRGCQPLFRPPLRLKPLFRSEIPIISFFSLRMIRFPCLIISTPRPLHFPTLVHRLVHPTKPLPPPLPQESQPVLHSIHPLISLPPNSIPPLTKLPLSWIIMRCIIISWVSALKLLCKRIHLLMYHLLPLAQLSPSSVERLLRQRLL